MSEISFISQLTAQADKAVKSKDTNQLPSTTATSLSNDASRANRQYNSELFSNSVIEAIGNHLNVFA